MMTEFRAGQHFVGQLEVFDRAFAKGLNEHDVMAVAGHASLEAARRVYLAAGDDLLERTR
jgi:hypothetical protein